MNRMCVKFALINKSRECWLLFNYVLILFSDFISFLGLYNVRKIRKNCYPFIICFFLDFCENFEKAMVKRSILLDSTVFGNFYQKHECPLCAACRALSYIARVVIVKDVYILFQRERNRMKTVVIG